MKIRKKILIVFLALFALSFSFQSSLNAQESKNREANLLFIKIEDGLNTGKVDKFSSFFAGRNFISLSNGKSGYFSANQSYYILEDFLGVYLPINFKLTNVVLDTSTPFASGILKYNNKGIRGNATVFLSLQYLDEQWRISQITIN